MALLKSLQILDEKARRKAPSDLDAKGFYERYGRDLCETLATDCNTNWPYFKQIIYRHRRPSFTLARRFVSKSGNRLSLNRLLWVAHDTQPLRRQKRAHMTEAASA